MVFTYMYHENEPNVGRYTRWWFQISLFSPLPGEMIQFDQYFLNGLKPPTSIPYIECLGFPDLPCPT